MYKNLYLFILGLVTLGATASAQNIDVQSGFPADPNLKTGQLKNGIKYYIRKNTKPENRMELRLAVNAGSNQENDDQQGLAHFCEHMAFNGSKHFKKNDLVNFLEGVGTKFGAHLNAYTSFDETVYMLQVPTDNKETMNKAFLVLEDWATGLSFEGEEVEKERGVVIEEWRLGQGAQERMRNKYWPVLFGGSRYGDRLPIGKKEILEKFKHETLKKFYADWYRPDLMAVVAVGDFDVNEIEREIQTRFSSIPAAPASAPKHTDYKVDPTKEPKVAVVTDKESPYTVIQMLYIMPSLANDKIGDYRRNIVHSLYNSMLTARLAELQKQANPPFLFAGAGYENIIRTADAYTAVAVVSETGIEKGIKTLVEENERVKKFGFTEGELKRKKAELLSNMAKSFAERDKNESRNYAQEYVRNFLSHEPIPGIEFEYEMYKKFVPEITLSEVNELAKKWVTGTQNLRLIVMAPEKEGVKVPSNADVIKYVQDAVKTDLTAYVDNMPDQALVKEEPTPSKVMLTKDLKDIGAKEWTMRNGAKVIVKNTDYKNDEVMISAFSWGGTSLYPTNMLTNASVAADLVNNSGIGDFDANQLDKYMAGKICNISPFIQAQYEGMYGSSSLKDLETAMQMMYMYFTNPRIDDAGYASYMEQLSNELKLKSLSPEAVFSDSVQFLMAGRSERRKPQTIAMLDKINRDEALKIYKERFEDAGQFTFVFVGKIDEEKLKPLVEKYIGSLPSKKGKETPADEGIKYPTGKIEKVVKKGMEPKSQVMIYYNGDFEYNAENRLRARALTMLANIKLRESLREDKGGVYGVGCFVQPEAYPTGRFKLGISFGCDPTRADELINAAYKVIDEIKAGGANATDLNKVKETLRREFESDTKENNYWMSLIRNNTMYGENYEGYLNFLTMVEAIKGEDFKALADKYFSKNNRFVFKLMPEK